MKECSFGRRFGAALAVAILAMTTLAAAPAWAQFSTGEAGAASRPIERIAAVVNDEIISLSDLQARLGLALVASGLPDTPEARQRLMPQVLRTLVDERLQLQEAKRLNIRVTDQEIAEALARLAEQNRMSPEQMKEYLATRGVPAGALEAQTRANLAWSKVVQRRLRPSVDIGDEEIDAVLQRIQANAGKPEYLVAEIFLGVDSPERDEEVRRLADRLVDQIRQGANFPAVARQFSQSAVAAQGGDLGWVQQGQLPEELDRTLRELRPGQLSRPVRTFSGYHILLLRDERTVLAANPAEVKLNLKQIALPRDGASTDVLRSQAESISRTLDGCESMEAKAKELGGASGDLGTVTLADLPPEIARVVSGLAIGKPSQPLLGERGALILMVCSREAPASSLPPREEVMAMLGAERLDMLARRLLRDLRRAAFVDVRV